MQLQVRRLNKFVPSHTKHLCSLLVRSHQTLLDRPHFYVPLKKFRRALRVIRAPGWKSFAGTWFRKWVRNVSLGGTPSKPIVQPAPPPTPYYSYYDEMDGPGELTTEPSDSENEEVWALGACAAAETARRHGETRVSGRVRAGETGLDRAKNVSRKIIYREKAFARTRKACK